PSEAYFPLQMGRPQVLGFGVGAALQCRRLRQNAPPVSGRSHPGSKVRHPPARHAEQSRGAAEAKRVEKRWPDTPRSGTILCMAVVGDRVLVPSTKVGESPRDGVVTGV